MILQQDDPMVVIGQRDIHAAGAVRIVLPGSGGTR
jgi:hypothetical protein